MGRRGWPWTPSFPPLSLLPGLVLCCLVGFMEHSDLILDSVSLPCLRFACKDLDSANEAYNVMII